MMYFLSLKIVFISANGADRDENADLFCISSGFSLFAKVLFTSIQNVKG